LDELEIAVAAAQGAASIVKTLGLFEFIIVIAVVVGFIIFLKVLLPKMIKISETKMHNELMTFQDLVVEVKQIVENYDNRFENLENSSRERLKFADDVQTSINNLMEGQRKNRLSILRLNVWDEKLDIWSRLEAGVEYLKLGGNHKTKDKLKELALHNPDTWNIVLHNNPDIVDPDYLENSIKDINRSIKDISHIK
jgi:hypothetical protein